MAQAQVKREIETHKSKTKSRYWKKNWNRQAFDQKVLHQLLNLAGKLFTYLTAMDVEPRIDNRPNRDTWMKPFRQTDFIRNFMTKSMSNNLSKDNILIERPDSLLSL